MNHLLLKSSFNILQKSNFKSYSTHLYSTLNTKKKLSNELNKYRNIGIIAHVDAGKTTTCERMLFYSGEIKRIGEVHRGDTVMDYLKMERERGITITAATITFPWDNHRINLVDTPGHVDFTVEVERSVRVMDGTVAIFDAVAGVQAQSITVWNQSERYKVPRLAFINKMDREGATMEKTLKMMKNRLGCTPLVLQMPLHVGPQFSNVVDLLTLKVLGWNGEKGEIIEESDLAEYDEEFVNKAKTMREELINQLAEMDEEMMKKFFDNDCNVDSLSLSDIKAAIRRVTVSMQAVPTLFGSSLKNKGVQQVLNSVVDYLPSPLDRDHPTAIDRRTDKPLSIQPNPKDNLCALAFKVVNDKKRGMIVYTRVYSGVLRSGATIFNSRSGEKERVQKLFQVAADEMEEIQELRAGDIGAVIGLKNVSTGDTLIYDIDKQPRPMLSGITPPPPVFFCALEPDTEKDYEPLIESLEILQKEDPSFQYRISDQQQILISGMGELHLEIIKDRLDNHFKVPSRMGRMQVSYKGTVQNEVEELDALEVFDIQTSGGLKTLSANISVLMKPREAGQGNLVEFILPRSQTESMDKSTLDRCKQSIQEGIDAVFMRGLPLGFPVTDTHVVITHFAYKSESDTPPLAFRNGIMRIMMRMAESSAPAILEPMMKLEISVDEKHLGVVLSDLTKQRRATINEVGMEKNTHIISSTVPLKEMIGYSTILRSISHGSASFTMEYSHNGIVSSSQEIQKIFTEIRGY
ncbi:mitochondrial translation elongation factor G [Cavenderia fasciculata]|uniref:Mitochondrial translation elongation factor G n=1 Tax=Cavenderia fasciculata TaxID=261658 RepID=F4QED5_CACFS|nr:mitochondrial translation elongation factor G [Cavenderia fasciculata]EGG14082.1 mitochondrial translation elongation factor G [Cavenderia fasciculata]|eukprot:XP_004350790.1 mitochondrial translation elongation factor G [Cavenderia fasciculata]